MIHVVGQIPFSVLGLFSIDLNTKTILMLLTRNKKKHIILNSLS